MKNQLKKYRHIYLLNILLLYVFVSIVSTDSDLFHPTFYERYENKSTTELVHYSNEPINFLSSNVSDSEIPDEPAFTFVPNLYTKYAIRIYDTLLKVKQNVNLFKQGNFQTNNYFQSNYLAGAEPEDDEPSLLI